MPITLQDLQRAAWTMTKLGTTGETNDIASGPGRVMAVYLYRVTTDGTIDFDDIANYASSDLQLLNDANVPLFINLAPGGWRFSTGISVTSTNTAAAIWWIADPA